MTIRPDEAAPALRDAEAAAHRSTAAVGYQRASRYLILWGAVWLIGNVLGYLKAPYGNVLFPLLMLVGVGGSFVLGLRSSGAGPRRNYALRSVIISLAIGLFASGVGVVTPGATLIEAEAVICLAIGAAYMIMGVSMGLRLSAVGLALMAATMVAWMFAREQFFLCMAFVGGGGLILGGLWLRKA